MTSTKPNRNALASPGCCTRTTSIYFWISIRNIFYGKKYLDRVSDVIEEKMIKIKNWSSVWTTPPCLSLTQFSFHHWLYSHCAWAALRRVSSPSVSWQNVAPSCFINKYLMWGRVKLFVIVIEIFQILVSVPQTRLVFIILEEAKNRQNSGSYSSGCRRGRYARREHEQEKT